MTFFANLEPIILAARAREASRAAQQEVARKSATSNRLTLPGKYFDTQIIRISYPVSEASLGVVGATQARRRPQTARPIPNRSGLAWPWAGSWRARVYGWDSHCESW